MSPEQMVDLQRYPIHALDTATGQALLDRCHDDLENRALCMLPEFIQPGALERLVDEVSANSPQAFAINFDRSAYEDTRGNLPAEHPTNVLHPCRYGQILTEDISAQSLLRVLYGWPLLTDFVRRALREESLYRSACPYLGLTVQVSGNDDLNGWHFDGNDFVVSLLLQAPDSGGEFEYAPYIRRMGNENYSGVHRVFADPNHHAIRYSLEPGTFVLFKGDLSVHRVKTIGPTNRNRMIALFSYDRHPDQDFGSSYVDWVKSHPRLGESQIPIEQ